MKHGNPIENNGWFFFTQENLLLITPSNFQKKCTEVYRKEIWNLTPPPTISIQQKKTYTKYAEELEDKMNIYITEH